MEEKTEREKKKLLFVYASPLQRNAKFDEYEGSLLAITCLFVALLRLMHSLPLAHTHRTLKCIRYIYSNLFTLQINIGRKFSLAAVSVTFVANKNFPFQYERMETERERERM